MKKSIKSTFAKASAATLITATLTLSPALAIAQGTHDTTSDDACPTCDLTWDEEGYTYTNEQYVADLKGLTQAERAELASLYDRQDAYWDGMDDLSGLTQDEWDRMEEIEEKAWKADLAKYLSKDEVTELEGLYEKLDGDAELTDEEWERMEELEALAWGTTDGDWDEYEEINNEQYAAGLEGITDAERTELVRILDKMDAYWDAYDREHGLTDAEWDRICELEDKAWEAELAENLTSSELAELRGLYERLDADDELTDEEWERLCELEDKGWGTTDESWDDEDWYLLEDGESWYLNEDDETTSGASDAQGLGGLTQDLGSFVESLFGLLLKA